MPSSRQARRIRSADLAAVGDDELLDHDRFYSTTNSGWPNSTGSPFWP